MFEQYVKEDAPRFNAYIDGNCTEYLAVLDADWRWIHYVDSYSSCTRGFSPDEDKHCVIEGVDDYEKKYGVSSTGVNGVQLRYVSSGGNSIGSRVYVVDPDTLLYERLLLKNRQLSMTVDMSELPCGVNGAAYLLSLNESTIPLLESVGGSYGDAQCPKHMKLMNGTLTWKENTLGSCAPEIDIVEGNSRAMAWTLHPCVPGYQTFCSGRSCDSTCDKSGVDFNPYKAGYKDFYGPDDKHELNSSQPFTIVMQFITDDQTDEGGLVEIRRFYEQSGKIIRPPPTSSVINSTIAKFGPKDHNFDRRGGLSSLSKSLEGGMVLVFSMWDDPGTNMAWLDSGLNGPCSGSVSTTVNNRKRYPNATIRYTDIAVTELLIN